MEEQEDESDSEAEPPQEAAAGEPDKDLRNQLHRRLLKVAR